MVDYTGVAGLFRARDRVGSSLFDKGVQLINAVAKYVHQEVSVHIAHTLGDARDVTKGDLVITPPCAPLFSGGPFASVAR